MNTPFTTEQFFEVFRNYNLSVFPMQFIFYIPALLVIYFIFKHTSAVDKIISAVLSVLWFWMGIVYHLFFFTEINNAAYIFGFLFIIQGIIFFIYGVLRNELSFKFTSDKYGFTGACIILYALIVYPVLGYILGHRFPYSPTFGLPCPTVIFTFGVLMFTNKKCPYVILIIPFIWSIIGFTAVFNFGIIEDTGLLISGITALIMILNKNKIFIKIHV